MIKLLLSQIDNWNNNKNIKVVWLEGNGGKSFCAGGDLKHIYDAKVV